MSGAGAVNRPSSRRGSRFTDKQVAAAVKDGKAVEVTFPDGSTLTGWFCGLDDYHWGVVDSIGVVTLVHKAVPKVRIMPEGYGLPAEASQPVSDFRAYVMREFYGQTSQPQFT